MLRWCVQQGLVVIPKSVHPDYIKQNAAIFDFELENAEIVQLGSLNKGIRTCVDPTHIP
jgi:2,5-diketo-D-gluconate reductase A